MSTNFYLHLNACTHCNTSTAVMHIGKRSAGWTFLWRGHKDAGVLSMKDWQEQFKNTSHVIKDEYGLVFSVSEFMSMIESINYNSSHFLAEDFFNYQYKNCFGPTNAIRVDDEGAEFCDSTFC